MEQNNLRIKRIDKTSTHDPVTVENAELAKVNLSVERVDAKTEAEIIAAAKDTDIIMTRYAQMSRSVIGELPKLQAIIRYGIGYDTIDIDAATDYHVLAVNVPDFCYEEVSNHAMGMLLILARKLMQQSNTLKKDGWQAAYNLIAPMGSITGQTLGIIGCGHIGRIVARKAQCFGMNVIGYDPHVDQNLTKPTAYIVNTSRGPVIDQQALVKALKEKWIAGAGIDVFEKEPIGVNDPLLKMNNVILTAHTAFYSDASDIRVRTSVAQEAVRIALGHLPKNIVNKGVKPKVNLLK